MIVDFRGETVLVTGGTMGIGLAIALAFGQHGAQCWLTYKWGTADEDEVYRRFSEAGAPRPHIVRADVSSVEDTDALLHEVRGQADDIRVLVSNVTEGPPVQSFEAYSARAFLQAVGASAWPMVEYTQRIRRVLGRYPRYVVGISSVGPDTYTEGYDLVAGSKAVMETLCRYMAYRLFDEGVRINVVRSGVVFTTTLREAVGDEFEGFVRRYARDEHLIRAEEVGDVVVALCSGLMDGVTGQIISVDRGVTFADNLMRIYSERDSLGL